ncbi:uncharacterized protein A4U43_C03F12830 [Asparagus officinalis]|uniref:Pentacotripeptide-repeat region of PRORP domain-containing protein n=1 Tax=Asparagus officinalis TaxID=4686 RepID=A0A5P1FBD0_ASPOF|nr:uncharacterized protein A4U43_C03F12830 [Asparagus officinalis]
MSRTSPQIQFNFTRLLNTCSSLSSLKRVHSLLITHGLHHHLPFSAKLLSLSSAFSPSILYARKLFDEIPHPDPFLFNTLFRAYSDLGPLRQVFPLYSRMHRLGLKPDSFTFPFILRSSAVLSQVREGRQAHCNVIKNGLDGYVFVNSSLIFLYSTCGYIFDMELVCGGVEVKNVVVWTAMVAGYVQNSMFDKGLNVFRLMNAENVRPNEVTTVSVLPACNGDIWLDSGRSVHGFAIKEGFNLYTTVVNALVAMYGKCGDLQVARYLFDEMIHRTLVSWNTMIAVYEQGNEGTKAIELFRSMIKSVKFNAVTLVSVISACATLGAQDIGKWVHDLATSRGLETDIRITNALIDMYSKCGNLDLAQKIFNSIKLKGVVSWSAMINAYTIHGRANEALELFNRMKAEGVKPNSFTYTSILSACSHSGLVEEGMNHFKSMREEYGINPKVEHCACVVDLLGRAGRLKEAYDFVRGMEMKPDTAVWGALLGACRIHGDVEMAELVFAEEIANEEDATKMRRLMKKKELKKMPGCSAM